MPWKQSFSLLLSWCSLTEMEEGPTMEKKGTRRPEKDLILTIPISCLYYPLPQLFSPFSLDLPVSSLLSSEHWERWKSEGEKCARDGSEREMPRPVAHLTRSPAGVSFQGARCTLANHSYLVSNPTSFSLSSDKKQFLEIELVFHLNRM